MDYDGEFRTVLFGGYNKEDVRTYLQEIEKKLEISTFRYEKEIADMKDKIKDLQKENFSLEELVKEYQIDINEKKYRLQNLVLKNVIDEDTILEQIETERVKDEIRNKDQDHVTENKKLKMQMANLEHEKVLLIKEKENIERELEELRPVIDNLQIQNKNESQTFILDEKNENEFNVIAKVLEDARLNARYIEEAAHQKAEKILEQAKISSQEYVEQRKAQIDKELENKGIRLMAAKYKIDAYRNELNNTQQKLFELCSDMEKMVGEMPQRLDQLWENERKLPFYKKINEDVKTQ